MSYGSAPDYPGRTIADWKLRPAMTLRSKLIGVQQLQAGDTVGYGSAFTADGPLRIGVVACGYADGYPRHAPTGTPVLVDGVRTRIVGRVSMDMITVDLGPVPDAGIGSEVTLWGHGPAGAAAHRRGREAGRHHRLRVDVRPGVAGARDSRRLSPERSAAHVGHRVGAVVRALQQRDHLGGGRGGAVQRAAAVEAGERRLLRKAPGSAPRSCFCMSVSMMPGATEATRGALRPGGFLERERAGEVVEAGLLAQ